MADREAASQRRRSRVLKGALIGTAALLVVSLVAGFVAVNARNDVAVERDRSELRRITAESANQIEVDRTRALLLAALVHDADPSVDTLGALQRALVRMPRGWLGRLHGRGGYTSVDFVPGSDQLVALGDGGLDVFDLDTATVVVSVEISGPGRVDVSDDGTAMLVADAGGRWAVVETSSWQTVVDGRASAALTAVAIDPSGQLVALGQADGRVLVHDAVTGALVRNVDGVSDRSTGVVDVAWSPGGERLLVAGGDNHPARLYDVESGRQLGPDLWSGLDDITAGSTAVGFDGDAPVVQNETVTRFDPDSSEPDAVVNPATVGRTAGGHVSDLPGPEVLVADPQGTIEIIDFETGSSEIVIRDTQSVATSGIAFDPGTRRVAVAGETTIDVWSLDGDRVLGPALRDGSAKASIDETGRYVALSSVEGSAPRVIVWDTVVDEVVVETDQGLFANFREGKLVIGLTGLGEDGQLAYADQRIWNPADGSWSGPIRFESIGVNQGRSPDGRFLAMPNRLDNRVLVLDQRSGSIEPLDDLRGRLSASDTAVLGVPADVEFNPTSTLLVGTLIGGSHVAVWDTATWELAMPIIEGEDAFVDIDFRADGEVAFTSALDGTVALRDPDDLSIITSAAGPIRTNASGHSAGITDDGRLAASFGQNGAVLWDVESLTPIGDLFPHASVGGWTGQIATAGLRMVTLVDGDAVVWNVNTDEWPEIACRAAGRNLTQAEWRQFGPVGKDYRVICPDFPPSG